VIVTGRAEAEPMLSLMEALRTYQRGEASAMWCAHAAGLSFWEFLDEMKAHDVPFVTDEDLLREQIDELMASLAKSRATGERKMP
jgi:hypothetical protein